MYGCMDVWMYGCMGVWMCVWMMFTAEFLDNFGVTPAHFAAQQGHLECLQVASIE